MEGSTTTRPDDQRVDGQGPDGALPPGAASFAERARDLDARREAAQEAAPEPEQLDPDQALKRVADGHEVTDSQQMSALEWLLSDDPDVGRIGTRTLRINVRSEDSPLEVDWTVRAIDGDELRRIANESNSPRARRREASGGQDELDYHCRVIAAATVVPNIRDAMKQMGAPNPSRFIRDRFAHKPGLIPQISAEIMGLSGFDESHVQEVDAGKS